MIADVTFERTVYHSKPTRFEAGTVNIADAVGLGAALEYVERLGIETSGARAAGLRHAPCAADPGGAADGHGSGQGQRLVFRAE